jgi:hypothetical protein
MDGGEDEDEAIQRLAIVLWEVYDGTHNRLYPSLTIHLSNFSRIFNSFGRSPLISPDISILVNGGHRARSDAFIDPVLFLYPSFSDILQTLRLQVDS